MLQEAEKGRTLSDEAHDAIVPKLRSELLSAQFALKERDFPVIVIVSGADGAGKGEMVHHLNDWLDPREVITHAFWDNSSDDLHHPEYWRFWRAMPGKGRIGILFGSWYSAPIIDRVMKESKRPAFEASLARIARFERMLTDSGAVLVKLWLHLSKPAQKARLKELEEDGRLGPDDWAHFKKYKRFRDVSDAALEQTHTRHAPWHVIEATDRRYREITAAEILLGAIEERMVGEAKAAKTRARKRAKVAAHEEAAPTGTKGAKGSNGAQGRAKANAASAANAPSATNAAGTGAADTFDGALDSVNLKQRLPKARYESQLKDLQERLSRLAWAAREAKVATVLAFEGWDAAGKGSAIRRVTQAMDPRLYRVARIAAPTEEERAQHYLWRFWRRVPRDGAVGIFDRSWYGRVLVERVEGFARPEEWQRAYDEINEFERQLTDHGTVVLKFWIHISEKEQLKRFKERETVPWKQYKITPDDWRNRNKIPEYRAAVEEMVARCDPPASPWTLVAGNDKRFARVQILRTIVERLEGALGG
jgi:polyphosphate kinase 2 (PPK2 family)